MATLWVPGQPVRVLISWPTAGPRGGCSRASGWGPQPITLLQPSSGSATATIRPCCSHTQACYIHPQAPLQPAQALLQPASGPATASLRSCYSPPQAPLSPASGPATASLRPRCSQPQAPLLQPASGPAAASLRPCCSQPQALPPPALLGVGSGG